MSATVDVGSDSATGGLAGTADGTGCRDGATDGAVDGTGRVGSGLAAGVAPVEPSVVDPVVVDPAPAVVVVLRWIGWIDTNVLSQIIRFGAYHHFVKKRLSWVTVSLVFGRMS